MLAIPCAAGNEKPTSLFAPAFLRDLKESVDRMRLHRSFPSLSPAECFRPRPGRSLIRNSEGLCPMGELPACGHRIRDSSARSKLDWHGRLKGHNAPNRSDVRGPIRTETPWQASCSRPVNHAPIKRHRARIITGTRLCFGFVEVSPFIPETGDHQC